MKIEYPLEGVVSVWIGLFHTEREFDKCIASEVAKRLALDVPIQSICEATFEDGLQSVAQLLHGFSGEESFGAAAEKAAKDIGIEQANAVLVCYYLKCSDAPSNWGALRFLGSFAGQDVQGD